MIVTLGGSSGFVGRALQKKIREKGWTLRNVSREDFSLSDEEFSAKIVEGADAVINLAGAPISKKWNETWKKEILDSRRLTTGKFVRAMATAKVRPVVFINASATGIYDSIGTHTETSAAFSDSFLGRVCREWETEALSAESFTRVVLMRTGMVLGKNGGALEKMYFPFSIGIGGKIGNGRQIISFIHLEDLVNVYLFALETPSLTGVVNAVSPFPVTNAEFTDTLGKVLNQPTWMTIPAFALKLLYGEGAQILLEGQKVLPEKLESAGFRFLFPTIRNSLVQIYR